MAKCLGVDYWWRNVREPVMFGKGVEYLLNTKRSLFVDVGPHPIMSYYVKEMLKDSDGGWSSYTNSKAWCK